MKKRRILNNIVKIKIFIIYLLSISLFITNSCNKDNPTSPNQTPNVTTTTVNGTVNTNEIGGTGLQIQSVYKTNCVVNNGQYSTDVSTVGTQLLFVTDVNQQIRGMSLSKIVNSQINILEFDAVSTAYSLLFITPGISSTFPDTVNQRMNRVSQLNSFNSLVTYLRSNLPNNTVGQIIQNQNTNQLLINTIKELTGIDSTKFTDKKLENNDQWFWVTKINGQSTKLENLNYRFVNIYRRDIKNDNTPKAIIEIWKHFKGGKPDIWGNIFQLLTNQQRLPIPETITDNQNITSDVDKLEYWVTGPGLAPSIIPPSNLDRDVFVEWLATAVFYGIFPIIDMIQGATQIIGVPTSDLQEKALMIANLIKTESSIISSYNAIVHTNFWSFLQTYTSFLWTVGTYLVQGGEWSILCTSGVVAPASAVFLSQTAFGIAFGLAAGNLWITAEQINRTPEISKYEIFTRIPHLQSPQNSSTVTTLTPTLTWTVPNNFQTTYAVQISESSTFTNNIIDVSGVTVAQYIVPQNKLEVGKQYWWRVKSEYENGSNWSDSWSFFTSSTGGLSAPTLLSPANGSTNQSLTPSLDWNDVTGATSYQVQVSTSSSFNTTVVYQTVTTSQYTVPSGLSNNTLYYWRVNASNGTSTSPWSSVWNFTTQTGGGGGWSPLSSGLNQKPNTLCIFNNELIVGGYFTIAGGVSANYIAKWNGSSWAPFSSGMNGEIDVLSIYNSELIAGGIFSTAGGVSANKIAKWNGSSWTSLGSGMNNVVEALTIYNGDLIAGGYFTSAGGVSANKIAKWNGSSWTSLGSGVSGSGSVYIYTLAVFNGELIVGGYFSTAGGVNASHIAKWNGSSWAPLGSGIDVSGAVWTLAVFNGELIVGGSFSTAGGVSTNNIAKWNGSSWAPLSSGTSYGSVSSLTNYGNELIVGGTFTSAGGVSANNIAKWNGSSWAPLGSGTNNAVLTSNVYNGELIAGGHFTIAGGNSANYIAKWNGGK